MLIPFLYYTGQNIQQIEKFMRDLFFNIMFEAPKHQGGELKDVYLQNISLCLSFT